MADQVASRSDNGQPVTWKEEGTGKIYTMGMVNGKPTGKKVYLSPRAVDPYSNDTGPYKSGLLGGGSEWDTAKGQWDKKSNTLEKVTLAAALSPFAAAAIGGVSGGGAAAGGGGAGSTPALSAPASWLPATSGGMLDAAAPAAAVTSAASAAPVTAAATMPELSAPASWLPAGSSALGAAPETAALPALSTPASVLPAGGSGLIDSPAAASSSVAGKVGGFLKSKGASIVGGALDSFLKNRQKNKELALEESKLDPYRAEMFQSEDANKLDFMANNDFASTPTSIPGRYGTAVGPTTPNFTWNPTPETRAAVRAALAIVRRGQPAK